ncbi:MAG: DUF309 domain-containing protein [Bryobacteraceae bacterium]|nr:DUF309 domain-containing protein [Bryobacteraceae bacterium]
MQSELLRGVELFNAGEYFEAHEAWERIWTAERGRRRVFLQALIHCAVALHHHGRGNALGARRQLRKAVAKLEPFPAGWEQIDAGALLAWQREALDAIARERPLPPCTIRVLTPS